MNALPDEKQATEPVPGSSPSDPATPVVGAAGGDEAELRRRLKWLLRGDASESPKSADDFTSYQTRPGEPLPIDGPDHAPAEPVDPGTLLAGRYRLGRLIACGGMGAVFRATDERFGREVALKQILADPRSEPGMVERFHYEARVTARLQHPGIPPVHDLGLLPDGAPFLAMKLIQGRTLSDHLRERKSPSEDLPRWIGVFGQIAQTVGYAHSRGVIHRDLKPSNIMVGAFGEVQVMDWGLAKVLGDPEYGTRCAESDPTDAGEHAPTEGSSATPHSVLRMPHSSATRAGTVLGTPAYMAPEQARGEVAKLDARADVFALGVILCEILTGETPYASHETEVILSYAANAELHAARACLASCGADAELIALAIRCLSASPSDRPADGAAVAALVADYQAAVETRLRQSEAERARGETQLAEQRKRRRVWLALAVVFLVGAVGAAILAVRAEDFAQDSERRADEAAQARDAAQQAQGVAERARADADEQRQLRQDERDQTRQNLYFAEMTLAGIASEAPAGLGRVHELLGRWGSGAPDPNPRGWEWYYLHGLSQQAIHTLHGHAGKAHAVAYAPDGKLLATGGDDHTARVWDTATGRELICLRGHTHSVRAVAWSPDGKLLATASEDGTARIWDVAERRELRRFSGHQAFVTGVAWSPDGTRIATAGHDSRVRVWNPETGEETTSARLSSDGSWAQTVAWSPDGKRIVVGTWNHEVRVVNSETGAVVTRLVGHTGGVLGVCWSPNGTRIATASADQTVRVWDPNTGKLLTSLQSGEGALCTVGWSPDGKRIAASGGNRAIQVWDADSGKPRGILRGNHQDVRALAWSPDGDTLAAACVSGVVRIWEESTGSASNAPPELNATAGTGFAWGPDGRMATRGRDATVRVWPAGFSRPALTLQAGKPIAGRTVLPSNRVSFSPDGTKVVAWCEDARLRIWDAASGETLRALVAPDRLLTTQWSPDGARIACSGWGCSLAVWDVQTGERLALVTAASGREFALAWSPDGQRIATSGDRGSVCIWDPASGRKLVESARHAFIRDLCWSPDGRRIASASDDQTARVWDAQTLALLSTLRGHSGSVGAVGWSPDGKRIATGSSDRTVKVWDVATGRETLTLRGHADSVQGVHWHPNGCRFATRDATGNVFLWDATTGFLAERSAAALPWLNERIRRETSGTTARRLRAEVLARQGDWDAAASEFGEVARRSEPDAAVYPAGWWLVAGAARPSAFPPAEGEPAARWIAPASDPNGYVSLPNDATAAVCRLFVPRATTVELEIGPTRPAGLWVNGQPQDPVAPGRVTLPAGWNFLALEPGEGSRELFMRFRADRP
jgi:WD40 repeat protein/serine/threonine protein kinase